MRLNSLMGLVCVVLCSASAQAGAVGGQREKTDTVLPYRSDEFMVKFEADERSVVTIRGDGSTDLDFYVYDSNDNLMDKDDDATDICRLTWTPRWTGYFKIKILNLGSQENRYHLETN